MLIAAARSPWVRMFLNFMFFSPSKICAHLRRITPKQIESFWHFVVKTRAIIFLIFCPWILRRGERRPKLRARFLSPAAPMSVRQKKRPALLTPLSSFGNKENLWRRPRALCATKAVKPSCNRQNSEQKIHAWSQNFLLKPEEAVLNFFAVFNLLRRQLCDCFTLHFWSEPWC
jgi:hypothetical protein